VEREVLEQRKRDVEARYGAWSAHSLQLRDDLYTISPGAHWNHAARLRRVVQIVAGVARKPIAELRVLDLGALEGLFSVEFARRGAEVVAIEGREANVEKIRLAKEALGLGRLEVRQEDVRTLARERHGEFDVVLCLGVVCLLDAPDSVAFLERLHDVCRDVLVVEADTALIPDVVRVHQGRRYFGAMAAGERPGVDPLTEEARWTAMGNRESFRFSAASLANAIGDAGFPLVLQCHLPALSYTTAVTITYVALNRERTEVVAVPAFIGQAPERLEERSVPWTAKIAARARPFARRLVPAALRRAAERIGSRIVATS
jgi:SAM-dependent methyltransferase